MTIDQAIEILRDNVNAKPPGMNHDYFDAIKLGIEAMKEIKLSRRNYPHSTLNRLPGETEN